MPYKDPEQRKLFNKKYWMEHSKELSEANRQWKIENKKKHKDSRRRYLEENREIINAKVRDKYNKNQLVKYKKLVRCHTLQKYGKLKKGFVYHHNTEPYDVDKFDILEGDVHDYLEKNMSRIIKNKKQFGAYNL